MMKIEILGDGYIGKYTIADMFRSAVVAPLVTVQGLPDMSESILCVLDDVTPDNGDTDAKVTPIPDMWRDIIYQLSGHKFNFVLRLHQGNMRTQTPAQIATMIYKALRHVRIDDNDNLYYQRRCDVETWHELLPYVGNQQYVDVMKVKIYGTDIEGVDSETVGETVPCSARTA